MDITDLLLYTITANIICQPPISI